MATNHVAPPLFERIPAKNTLHRVLILVVLFFFISLIGYRLFSLAVLRRGGLPWLLALFCESCFCFVWICSTSTKWNAVDHITFPDRLLHRVPELPPVDLFVTTADAVLEPPIITVNTVLSLLALDYPVEKLACYVSDDGCSPLTFHSLLEASKFAKLWVPFCKKYGVQVRAPFRYFSDQSLTSGDDSSQFRQEWQKMKEEYKLLCQQIQNASQKRFDLTGEFADFADAERKNHPSIIKVIWENTEAGEDGVPHLVYISREKRPNCPHHYKAGAMNVLSRVSGMMTNAPFILNVDCDMFANNPQVVLHAMCLLLGSKNERDCGFVQFPQKFYDGLKDDPFGNQLIALQYFFSRGVAGLQGPLCGGTGSFHRRKVIYGLSPNESQIYGKKLIDEKLQKQFGKSLRFCEAAASILSGSRYKADSFPSLSSTIAATIHVASCSYEYNSSWGKELGWMYGSTAEDVLTGLRIHSKGWRSIYLDTNSAAFLGSAPTGGSAVLTQYKRWATGFMEIMFSNCSPLKATLTEKLEFRSCLFYLNSSFLPKVEDPAILIPVALFISYNVTSMWEFNHVGQSTRAWWNNEKMRKITSTSSWFFGFLAVILKLLRVSQTVFEITPKDQLEVFEGKKTDAGRFTFDESPIFISDTTIVFLNLTALAIFSLSTSTKWNAVDYITFPDRLLQRVPEIPPVDMFVTTAEAVCWGKIGVRTE
ncbi:hypothetical protein Nepgr_012865 [Nepenthes gracilis]|uniref:Cellulose synthase-like protein H1 n=1 Tax=Nepenthes gracilis TaxID=150966 RepID=A0AAD3XNK3_NEPGR|nr:hypothetical protein Nepgr_012865 [Nepenthes gracilis]